MSAVEVIAQALHRPSDERSEQGTPMCSCGHDLGWCEAWEDHATGAVLAAIRAMTPEQQAELIGGEVEVHEWWDIFPRRRAVGQWREFEKAGERS